MKPIFFYGSLRDPELIEIVLGRPLAPGETRPARAPGHATRRLVDEAYPVLVRARGATAPGLLLAAPDPDGLARLTFFEEAEYGLAPLTVETEDGPVEAVHFRGTEKPVVSDAAWDFARWQEQDRAVAVEAARELMDHYGRLPVEEIDTIWPGVMMRARQRARGRAAPADPGPPRRAARPGDVETLEMRRGYTSYLSVEEHRFRYRRFDGGWLGPVDRTAVLWGDAVTVLPYDPAADRLLLIEQFRPGPAARGDPNPWCLEVVAGRIDGDEDAEAVARREAAEEAGLDLGRIEEIGGYYPTPGLAAEHLTGFVAEARLDGAGGLYGVDHEHEDIRAMALGFDEAMAAVRRGVVNTGPALVSLLWLAVNRERLRASWARPDCP